MDSKIVIMRACWLSSLPASVLPPTLSSLYLSAIPCGGDQSAGPTDGTLSGAALAISLLVGAIVLAVVLLASLGTSLNELARTLPQYRTSLAEPLKTVTPWLQRFGFTVSAIELN